MTTQLDAPVQVLEARQRVNRRAVLVCILWSQQALMSHLEDQDQDWDAARADADRLTAAQAFVNPAKITPGRCS